MKKLYFLHCLFLLVLTTMVSVNSIAANDIAFDKDKWQEKLGEKYPFRDPMLNSILHTDLVRNLKKDKIIELLGEPTYYRDNKNYLYYLINKKSFFGLWTLHTKTLVIKLNNDNTVDWIKIHE